MVESLVYEFTIDSTVVGNDYFLEGTKIVLTRKTVTGNTCKLVVSKSILDVVSLIEGLTVIVKRGSGSANSIKFQGKIFKISENNGGDIVLDCYDSLYELKKLLFTKSYDKNIDPEAGEISAIFEDIVTNGGFVSSVVDTGVSISDYTLTKFKSDRQGRLNRMSVLGQIVNYVFYNDYDNGWIRFEPEGYSVYPNVLEVGVNVFNAPSWSSDITDMRNKIYVDGAFESDTRIESFSGDGSNSSFEIEDVAETLKVTVGGVLQVLGVEGSSEVFDYSHDKELKKIVFETGSIPASGTDNVVVEYSTLVPYTSVGQDDASINLYNVTQEESYTFKDIRTSEDADVRLEALLDKLKDGSVGTSLQTDEYYLKVGQKVSVVDPTNLSRSGDYFVQEIVINYPLPVDTVSVGDESFDINDLLDSVNERLNAVEGRDDLFSEVLRQLKNVSLSVRVEPRVMTIEKLSIIGDDTLYWNSDTNGTWNDFDWGVGVTTYDDSRKVIVMGGNTYREFCIDSDFVDSNTGVTVNTTLNRFEFSASGVLVLGPVSKNNLMSSFTLVSGDVTGSLSFEVSNDDKSSWETVSNLGTSQDFDVSGSGGVYVRITETSGVSTATLSSTKSIGGTFVTPCVQLFMVN